MAGDSDSDNDSLWYLLSHPPGWLIALWLVGVGCTAYTVLVSYRQTLEHVRAGRESGYGGNPFASFSFGPRANRMLHLLLMPPILSISAVCQMVLPSAEPLCSLLRTIQVSLAVLRLAELLFILAGGWTRVQACLPKEPIKPFAQPPLCFFACSRVVTEDDIRLMAAGLRQFGWGAPLLGTIDAYFTAVKPDHQGAIRSILVALYSVTTVIGMWSFNNIYVLLTRSLRSHHGPQRDRQAFVTMQMVSVKLVGLILRGVLPEGGYTNGRYWTMPRDDLSAVISGFFVCVVQLLLCLLGRRAFPASRRLYPTPDFGAGYPQDLLATLQMSGLSQGAYEVLRGLEAAATMTDSESSSSSCSDDEASGALGGGSGARAAAVAPGAAS